MEWCTLVEAPDQLTAEFWLDILRQEGIPARLAPQDVVSYLGVAPFPCRLLVPQEVVERAAEVLADVGVALDFPIR
ncbi:MAG: DUF2007 domain-containing protein [Chloroflexi bacterium]|nr:DUF2007 domain-containing protein [Chloroflexota bacterium]